MKKKSIMIGIEVALFCMIVGTLVSYAAGSNPPSEGVKYTNNGQATVQGALNDLYGKVVYGNASAGDILSEKTALIGGNKVTGTMSNQGGKTVSASTVTKSGTDALIKVPTTGYYNTSSSLKVPISTLQDAIGGNNIGWKSLYYKAGKSADAGVFAYTFNANYSAILIVMVVEDGQSGSTNGTDNKSSYRNVTFSGTVFTKISDQGAGGRNLRQIIYFAKNVSSNTKISFQGTATGLGEMNIYALSGVSSATEIYADWKEGHDTINLFPFTGDKAVKNAFCAMSNIHDGTGFQGSVLPIIHNSEISTASVTHIANANGKIKEKYTSSVLISNPNTSDYLSSTGGTADRGVIACVKLN